VGHSNQSVWKILKITKKHELNAAVITVFASKNFYTFLYEEEENEQGKTELSCVGEILQIYAWLQ